MWGKTGVFTKVPGRAKTVVKTVKLQHWRILFVERLHFLRPPAGQLLRRKNEIPLVARKSVAMPESTTTTSTTQTHYEVLALPSKTSDLTDRDIRLAYRRALLLHHPDKSPSPSPSSSRRSAPTIDAITTAYKTLIDPLTRSDYDRSLTTASSSRLKPSYPGLETVDLDDMGYDEEEQMWYRRCRCGKEGIYVVTEEELELNAEFGETITPCQGCSLWLRVTFAVVVED